MIRQVEIQWMKALAVILADRAPRGKGSTDGRVARVIDRRFIDIDAGPLEYRFDEGDPSLPTLVFLHEGLGSIDLWRDVPEQIRSTVGHPSSIVYARHGYGNSAAAELPRPVSYMHHEADVVLPALLSGLGVERPVLIGHSDGASIALLYAGAGHDVAAIVCFAPHVFVEQESIDGIEAAKATFESTDMAERMRKYHADPEGAFRGWNDAWLSPEFREWDITDRLGAITAPTLLVQGADDQYGTYAQLDAIAAGVAGEVEQVRLDGAGHAPHLDRPDQVVAAVAGFLGRRGLMGPA